MKALLIVQQGPAAGHSYALDPQKQSLFSMGRASEWDIVVLDPLASRHHCDLRWNGREWEIIDRRSTRGTLLNGRPLKPHEPSALHLGDQLAIGSSVWTLAPVPDTQPVAPDRPEPAQPGSRRPLVPILVAAIAVIIVGMAVGAALLLQADQSGQPTHEAVALTQVIVVRVTASPTDYPALTASPPPPTNSPMVTSAPPPTASPAPHPTGSALATDAPVPTVNVAEAVQAEFERLSKGRILYNPPEEMQVGLRERIEARISMDPAAPLEAGLVGEGVPQVEAIPVGCFMKVRLQGEAFEITALSSEEQVVPAEGFTQWSWDVTPKEAGAQSLFLIVTARVKLSGYADEQKDLGIIEREILIKVNPGHSIRSFFTDNQEWIYAVVIIPSLAALSRWLWTRHKRRTSSGSEKSEPTDRHTP